MKKIALLAVAALIGTMSALAQNVTVDLTKGTGRGITLSGTATLTSERGGDYFLPALEGYGMYKGIQIVFSNFKKLDENASDALCSLNVYFTNENGKEQKASMGFWGKGKKKIKFDSFRNGDETIEINPATITKIGIGMGTGKQLDVQIELVPRDPQE
ncbi:hypothetical protein [Bacteroides ovatus]|uniref:hypothetical protein n=1 Tax=Bacteroides ovatus TaxID=28116 RepID=UPI0012AB6254|nr:hypothetical protein [Bacteroides ovatus]